MCNILFYKISVSVLQDYYIYCYVMKCSVSVVCIVITVYLNLEWQDGLNHVSFKQFSYLYVDGSREDENISRLMCLPTL